MVQLRVSNKRAIPNGTHDCTIKAVEHKTMRGQQGEFEAIQVTFQPDGDGDVPFVSCNRIFRASELSPLSKLGIMANRLGLVDFEDPQPFDPESMVGLRCRVPIHTPAGENFPKIETDQIILIPQE